MPTGPSPALLAHQGGADEGLTTLLLLVAGLLAWVAAGRLRGTGFPRLPRAVAWAAAGLAPVVLVAAFVVPARLFPTPSALRPASSATVTILKPVQDAVFTGDPAPVTVRVRLDGGSLSPTTSTTLVPDQGHLHVYLDGVLVSMTQGLTQRLDVDPGSHVIRVDFVANDHGLFNPPVTTEVVFSVVAG